jgi:hypothetical protein
LSIGHREQSCRHILQHPRGLHFCDAGEYLDSSPLALIGLAIHHACDWANAVLRMYLMKDTVIEAEYRLIRPKTNTQLRPKTNTQRITDVGFVSASCACLDAVA